MKKIFNLFLFITLSSSLAFTKTVTIDDLLDDLNRPNPITGDIEYRRAIYKFVDLLKTFNIQTFVYSAIARGKDDNIIGTLDNAFIDRKRNKIYSKKPISKQKTLVDLAVELATFGATPTGTSSVATSATITVNAAVYDGLAMDIFKSILLSQKKHVPGIGSWDSFKTFVTNIKEHVIKKIPAKLRAHLTSGVQDFLVDAKRKGKWSITNKNENKELINTTVNELLAMGFKGLKVQ
jgi:hypothetical protein